MAAGFAYGENSEGPINSANPDAVPGFQCLGNNLDGNNPITGTGPDTRCQQYGGSISIMHTESGIYGNFAAGLMHDEAIETDPGYKGIDGTLRPAPEPDSYFYAFEAGIERKWLPLGTTTIFGQYYHNEGGSQDRSVGIVDGGCTWNDPNDTNNTGASGGVCVVNTGDIASSEITSYGAGVVQAIDAAAMSVYLTYRRYEGEVTTNGRSPSTSGETYKLDDLDVVMAGGIIKF